MEQITGHKLQMGIGWTENVRISRNILSDGSVEYRLLHKNRISIPYEKRKEVFDAFQNDSIEWGN